MAESKSQPTRRAREDDGQRERVRSRRRRQNSWLVCLLNFWLRNEPLVKVGNPISDDIFFVFHLAGCGSKSPSSDTGLT